MIIADNIAEVQSVAHADSNLYDLSPTSRGLSPWHELAIQNAWEAGHRAALDDAAPVPPRYTSPWANDLAASWLDGWGDGSQVLIAREAAKEEVYRAEREWDSFMRTRGRGAVGVCSQD